MRSSHVRLGTPIIVALFVAVACTSAASPAPVVTATPATLTPASSAPSTPPTPSQPSPPSAQPTATPSGVAARWEPAGTTTIGRYAGHALLLGDGRVIVVGDRGYTGARAELWDPVTGAWHTTESLNKARGGFAAVTLLDGRALVAGGLNADSVSYSSAYVYDPATEHWTKVGLMGTARGGPVAAVLRDGRVLVAGGAYCTGFAAVRPTDVAVLAAYHAGLDDGDVRLADTEPPPGPQCHALATAELFDPSSGTWSATGPMHYANAAAAVTLADGRVLVAAWGGLSTEIYDPKTGRFSLAGALPEVDRKALEKLGVPLPEGDPEPAQNGTLVALDDGGALLMGHAGWWKHEGDISRSFRFEPATGQWSEIGQPSAVTWDNHPPWGVYKTPGALRFDALVAGLPDGRVLVAGGADAYQESGTNTPTAELYDPVSNAWSPLPPMPEARAAGATVVLKDGSVLLVGGYDQSLNTQKVLTSAVRFIPSQ